MKLELMFHCKSKYVIYLGEKSDDSHASKIVTIHGIRGNRHSADTASVVPVSCAVTDIHSERNDGTIHIKFNMETVKGEFIL